jgi:uncharacterized membrane protein
MAIKLVSFFTLFAYSVIVSQSFMYILALKNALLNLGVESYTEIRKQIDTNMRSKFRYVIYTALLANLLLVISAIKDPGSLLFITATIAFVALVADTLVTIKGNLPVNDIINGWTADNYPSNWMKYRTKWLAIFQYRQALNITGFVSLLIGVVFGS